MDKHFKTGALVLLPKSQSNPTQNTATDTVSVTLPLFADMVVGRHQQQQVLGRLPDAGVVMQRSISNGVHTAPTYANWICSDNSLLVTAKYKYCNQTTRRLCSYGYRHSSMDSLSHSLIVLPQSASEWRPPIVQFSI